MDDAALARLISDSLAAHDPLDPWLVVSNYDQSYWDDVASNVAASVRRAASQREVFEVLSSALSELVNTSDADPYARDRIGAAADEIWRRRSEGPKCR